MLHFFGGLQGFRGGGGFDGFRVLQASCLGSLGMTHALGGLTVLGLLGLGLWGGGCWVSGFRSSPCRPQNPKSPKPPQASSLMCAEPTRLLPSGLLSPEMSFLWATWASFPVVATGWGVAVQVDLTKGSRFLGKHVRSPTPASVWEQAWSPRCTAWGLLGSRLVCYAI